MSWMRLPSESPNTRMNSALERIGASDGLRPQLQDAVDLAAGAERDQVHPASVHPSRVEAPALAITTSPIATQSRSREVLPEHDEARQRGDRRLDRHQHAEHAPGQRAAAPRSRASRAAPRRRARPRAARRAARAAAGRRRRRRSRTARRAPRPRPSRWPARCRRGTPRRCAGRARCTPPTARRRRARTRPRPGRASRRSSRRARGCPTAANATHTRSSGSPRERRRRAPSGPMNSNVTATPSGIRSIAS